MQGSVEEIQAEFVALLRKQVEALELDIYVGLTEDERSEYYKRQERIRDLNAEMCEPPNSARNAARPSAHVSDQRFQ